MLVFVDYEHADGYSREYGERIQAARTWITYRLEDLSGLACMLVRYNRISQELLDRVGATAIFISGNTSGIGDYDPAEVASIKSIIANSGLPVFGFCGGYQLVCEAFGAKLERLGEGGPDAGGDPVFEFGYDPVEVLGGHELWTGIDQNPIFRHAHGLHVPEAPNGFDVLARTKVTPIQMVVADDLRIVGTQFHPEYWTDEHPAGAQLIANFMTWANLV